MGRVALVALLLVACPREPVNSAAARLAAARSFPKPTLVGGKRVYAPHRDVPATIFWVGEPSTKQNGCTPNNASAFDFDWLGAYGGCDAHAPRITEADGFNRPEGFVPRENPYYFALPYGTNEQAPWRDEIPWSAGFRDIRSAVKNRWIAVRVAERTCYAQWEDVGPFCTDDAQYVFGYGKARNDGKTCDVAGPGNGTISALDVSPAVATCLGKTFDDGLFNADWRFVEESDVPAGPWRRVITTSPVRDGPPRDAGPCVQSKPYPLCGG